MHWSLWVYCRCAQYPDFMMDFLQRKVTLSRRRDAPHWSVEETMARGFQEPVWSSGDGWYWTQSEGWFELIPRNRGRREGTRAP